MRHDLGDGHDLGDLLAVVRGIPIMNRSFLIILLPAIGVAIGYVVVLRRIGYALEPLPFLASGLIIATAILFVRRHQRRKPSRRSQ